MNASCFQIYRDKNLEHYGIREKMFAGRGLPVVPGLPYFTFSFIDLVAHGQQAYFFHYTPAGSRLLRRRAQPFRGPPNPQILSTAFKTLF